MKSRQRDSVSDNLVGELGESRLRVGGVGETHRRVGVTQAPARPECHAAGQVTEFANDVADARADEQVVIEVAILDLRVAIEAVVVVVFAAEIEDGRCQCVVKQAVGNARGLVPADHERPVLIERIRGFGVIAKRVDRKRTKPAAVLVEWARFVAETEISIRQGARHVVPNDAAALAPLVREGGSVGGEDFIAGAPVQAERPQPHRQRKLSGRELDFARTLHNGELRERKPAHVEAITTLPWHVDIVRHDHPGPRFFRRAIAQEQDANEVVGQHEDPALPAGLEVKAYGIGKAPGKGGAEERPHR